MAVVSPRKLVDRKGPAALRKLARAHAAAALRGLAEVATTGNSEASRIAAAMALLDRGYGKSGAGPAGDDEATKPVLYQRIELIDGTDDKADTGCPAPDRKD